jgi:hypothetical protein
VTKAGSKNILFMSFYDSRQKALLLGIMYEPDAQSAQMTPTRSPQSTLRALGVGVFPQKDGTLSTILAWVLNNGLEPQIIAQH